MIIIIIIVGRQFQLMLRRGLVCPNQFTKNQHACLK